MGADGVFQEAEIEDSFTDLKTSTRETIKAYLPWERSVKKQTAQIEAYINSVFSLFPGVVKPQFSTKTIINPDWGEQWKKFFKPLRVSNNIVIKPTWERYSPAGRDIVIDIDPGMAFGTGRACLNGNVHHGH